MRQVSPGWLRGVSAGIAAVALLASPGVADAYVYWSHLDGPGLIGRALVGSPAGEYRWFKGAKRAASGIAVDAHHVYWTEQNSIGRANLDGSGFRTRAAPSGPSRRRAGRPRR